MPNRTHAGRATRCRRPRGGVLPSLPGQPDCPAEGAGDASGTHGATDVSPSAEYEGGAHARGVRLPSVSMNDRHLQMRWPPVTRSLASNLAPTTSTRTGGPS